VEPFFRDFAKQLATLHDGMDAALADLPVEALDYVPGQEMNSLAVLATHVAEAERYWIAAVAGGEATERVREREFQARGQDAETLRGLLADALESSQQVLARLRVDELDRQSASLIHDRTYSMSYALVHGLAPTAEHMGHMQMVRQLWEQRQQGQG